MNGQSFRINGLTGLMAKNVQNLNIVDLKMRQMQEMGLGRR